MATWKLDPITHDLVTEAGQWAEVSGIDEIRQNVKIALLLFRGEAPFNQDLGIPYIGEVLERGTPPQRIEAIFRETIEAAPGVTEITEGPELDFDSATRKLDISFRANTDEGELIFTDQMEVAA